MRLLNHGGRPALAVPGGLIDVERAGGGRFGSDVQGLYARWDEFREWAAGLLGDPPAELVEELDERRLGPPAPLPPQVFAVGLNYRSHAAEAGIDLPDEPFVFTKFPASVTGPYAEVELPSETVDWEVRCRRPAPAT